MSMVKEVADIKTSDQLNLPVPEVDYKTIVIKPTEEQKEYVADLGGTCRTGQKWRCGFFH